MVSVRFPRLLNIQEERSSSLLLSRCRVLAGRSGRITRQRTSCEHREEYQANDESLAENGLGRGGGETGMRLINLNQARTESHGYAEEGAQIETVGTRRIRWMECKLVSSVPMHSSCQWSRKIGGFSFILEISALHLPNSVFFQFYTQLVTQYAEVSWV